MKKLFLAILITISVNLSADSYIPDIRTAWSNGSYKTFDANHFYIDENGYVQAYQEPKGYIDWTYTDENVYDYTIKIIIDAD